MEQSSRRRRGGKNKKSQQQSQTQRPRRTQIVDDDGWTHVVTTSKRPPKKVDNNDVASPKATMPSLEDTLLPSEAPEGMTLERLRAQFDKYLERWESSTTWAALQQTLQKDSAKSVTSRLEQCVSIGLGSPSGLLRGGLVDRRTVSMYQLAALVALLRFLGPKQTPAGADSADTETKKGKELPQGLTCYAQDPVFNALDTALLRDLGITPLTDTAFTMVDESTFLYAPGAERVHLAALLSKEPSLFFGGPLSDVPVLATSEGTKAEVATLDAYCEKHASVKLIPFEPNNTAFWKTQLFWRVKQQTEEIPSKESGVIANE